LNLPEGKCASAWSVSLSWFRVDDLGTPTERAKIITTRHPGLIEFIRAEGLAKPDAPVEPHAQREHVEGKHAVSICRTASGTSPVA
jgi:hypothetical protein